MWRGQPCFIGADRHAVDRASRGTVALDQEATDRSSTATQIKHARPRRYLTRQHGQRGAFVHINVTRVDVQFRGGNDHILWGCGLSQPKWRP